MFETFGHWFELGWEHIKPFYIIEQYNRGIQLRFGKFNKVLNPGIHFKIPFFDLVIEHEVVPTTMRLHAQSLTTKDEKNIVVEGIIKYRIADIKVFLLEVSDAVDAISDMTQAIVKTIIMERDWQECKGTDIDNKITIKARTEAKKWGIDIIQVTLSDMAQIRSIRLITNSDTSHLI